MKAEFGDADWQAHYALPEWRGNEFNPDVQVLVNTIINHWDTVFSKGLQLEAKHLVHQVRKTRNRLAHQEKFDLDDTYSALHEVQRL